MNPRCLVLDCFTFKISSILKKKLNEKFLFVAAGALLLSAGAFTANAVSKANTQNSDLMIANLEALADNESGGNPQYAICVKVGYPSSSMHYKCPEGTKILPCKTMVAETAYPFGGMGKNPYSGDCYLP